MGELDPLNRRHTLVYTTNYGGFEDGEGLRKIKSMSQHSLRRRSSFGLQSTASSGMLQRKMSVISPTVLTGHLNQDVVVQIAILVSVGEASPSPLLALTFLVCVFCTPNG